MGIATILDRAGPALASGIILALLTGAAASALAWRDLSSASGVRWAWVTEQITDIRSECGGKDAALAKLEERVRYQENRPPRLNPALDNAVDVIQENKRMLSVLDERVKALEQRIVGVGPHGWHRADHDLYDRQVQAQLDAINHRLESLEGKRK